MRRLDAMLRVTVALTRAKTVLAVCLNTAKQTFTGRSKAGYG